MPTPVPAEQRVDADRPTTRERQVEPQEAVVHCWLAAVEHRPEALTRVADEIGDRHLAREQERHGPREQADRAAGIRRRSRAPPPRRRARRAPPSRPRASRGREREELGGPELQEQKAGHDAQDAERAAAPGRPNGSRTWKGSYGSPLAGLLVGGRCPRSTGTTNGAGRDRHAIGALGRGRWPDFQGAPARSQANCSAMPSRKRDLGLEAELRACARDAHVKVAARLLAWQEFGLPRRCRPPRARCARARRSSGARRRPR